MTRKQTTCPNYNLMDIDELKLHSLKLLNRIFKAFPGSNVQALLVAERAKITALIDQ